LVAILAASCPSTGLLFIPLLRQNLLCAGSKDVNDIDEEYDHDKVGITWDTGIVGFIVSFYEHVHVYASYLWQTTAGIV
jgi:hypothetical protein